MNEDAGENAVSALVEIAQPNRQHEERNRVGTVRVVHAGEQQGANENWPEGRFARQLFFGGGIVLRLILGRFK